MKKLLLLSLVITSFTLTSCSSDDDHAPMQQETGTDANLVGTWTATDVDYSGFTSTFVVDTGTTLRTEFTGQGVDIDLTLSFSESPNELTSVGTFDVDLTTVILGVSEDSMLLDLGFLTDGTWSRVGNTLTLVGTDSSTSEVSIELLTENSLRLRLTEGFAVSTDEVTQEESTVTVVTLSR